MPSTWLTWCHARYNSTLRSFKTLYCQIDSLYPCKQPAAFLLVVESGCFVTSINNVNGHTRLSAFKFAFGANGGVWGMLEEAYAFLHSHRTNYGASILISDFAANSHGLLG